MLSTRVPSLLLAPKRLDPDYYRPEHIRDERVLREFGALQLRETGKFFAGPFGSALPSELYLDSGVPLFRVGNVGEMTVIYDGMAHLDEAVHQELLASEVRPGDLLIVKASVGEKICVVPEWIPRANITQHIIAIHPNGSHDIEFVAAFLFTGYGRRQLERRSLGSIIQYLGVTDAKDVLLPKLSADAERYIGEKIRKAELMRVEATSADSALRDLTSNQDLENIVRQAPRKSGRVQAADLEPRIDAKYYELRAHELAKACRSQGNITIRSLKPAVSNGFEYRDFVDEGIPYITVTEISSGRLHLDRAPRIPRELEVPQKALVNERSVLVVRTGSVGMAAKVHPEDSNARVSSDFIKLQFADEETAAAVAIFLGSHIGEILMRKISYGAVQPHVGQDELLELCIPSALLKAASSILSLWRAAETQRRFADRLVRATKFLVEALIEGLVTEAELAAAQQALDFGNPAPDRALLARLTRTGFDLPGDPLFSDLEALDAALATAAAETTNQE